MADNDCSASSLATILGALRGVALPELPVCTAAPAYRVLIRHETCGVRAELLAEVCTEHEVLLDATTEHVRSWKLRRWAA